jgi:uncharacterized membrane protein
MSEAGAPRRRNIWLILSLCLNVVLIAMIAVGIARAWHHQQEAALGRAFSAQSIIAHLPSDRAEKVQAVLDAHAAQLNALTDAASQARVASRPVFAATNFDRANYAKAQLRIRTADDALEAEKMAQLADIAALLTPDERQAIVDRASQQKPKP